MAKKGLRELSRERATGEELNLLLEEIPKATDRHAVILLCSLLQSYLCVMIIRHLKNDDVDTLEELYEHGGPLSSFYSQIHLAYALGLFDKKIKRDLNTVRTIRNVFAHAAKPVSFKTDRILAEVAKLNAPTYLKSPVKVPDAPRQWFIGSVILLIVHILEKDMKRITSQQKFWGRKARYYSKQIEKTKSRIEEIKTKIAEAKASPEKSS